MMVYMSRAGLVTLGVLHLGLVNKPRCIPFTTRGVVQLLFVPRGTSGDLFFRADLVFVCFFYSSVILITSPLWRLFRSIRLLRNLLALPFLGLFGM
jgi:hypothetical protein